MPTERQPLTEKELTLTLSGPLQKILVDVATKTGLNNFGLSIANNALFSRTAQLLRWTTESTDLEPQEKSFLRAEFRLRATSESLPFPEFRRVEKHGLIVIATPDRIEIPSLRITDTPLVIDAGVGNRSEEEVEALVRQGIDERTISFGMEFVGDLPVGKLGFEPFEKKPEIFTTVFGTAELYTNRVDRDKAYDEDDSRQDVYYTVRTDYTEQFGVNASPFFVPPPLAA